MSEAEIVQDGQGEARTLGVNVNGQRWALYIDHDHVVKWQQHRDVLEVWPQNGQTVRRELEGHDQLTLWFDPGYRPAWRRV